MQFLKIEKQFLSFREFFMHRVTIRWLLRVLRVECIFEIRIGIEQDVVKQTMIITMKT